MATTLEEARRFAGHLAQQRSARLGEWRELAEWIAPHRGIFDGEDTAASGTRRNREAFTQAATQALLRGASGMTSGMTPRGISWFEPDFQDGELWEKSGAPAWLDRVDRIMKDTLADGGFYQAIHAFNMDLIWAGCALLYSETATASAVRFECVQIGTFSVGLDDEGRLDAVCRTRLWTPARLAARFGTEALSGHCRAALEREPFRPVRVHHLVRRRDLFAPGRSDARAMPWESLFWEDGGEDFLHVGGYREMPYFFTCWHEGVTPYGTGPGDDALSDARQLDLMERHKLEGLAKLTRPPVQAPTSLRAPADLSPGAVNAVPEQVLITPILDLSPYARAFQFLQTELQTVAGRLEHALMASIFASMPLEQRPRDMSATEFLERKREALQQLGPVMSAYEPNVLTPLLHRVAAMLDRAGLMPPPPRSLAGVPVFMKMSFTSPIANALRQNGAETTRALIQDVLALAQADPQVLDKMNLDQAVDELATGNGAPGGIIRADADVRAIRQQRAQTQAAQLEDAAAQQTVQTAEDMARTAKIVSDIGIQQAAMEAENG